MKMNNLSKNFLFIAVILMCVSNLNAQDKDNPWIIGFGLNAVDFYPTNINGMVSSNGVPTKWYDQFFNLTDHYNYISAPTKLSVGRYLNESFSVEIAGSINKISKVGTFKLNESVSYLALDVNANYNINKIIGNTKWFNPYAIAGAGFNAKGNDASNKIQFKNHVSFNSGLGAKIWFQKKLGFKIQTVYKHFFNDKSFPHFQHSASIIYKFGGYDEDNDGVYDKDDKCPEVFGLAEFEGCPDTDGDGVEDSKDECPNVFGVKELKGCPDIDGDGVADKMDACPYVKGLPQNNGCPDTDGDGIIDQRDACPNNPGPASNKGCPETDTDGDGIIDKLDKCKFEPGTINNNGCPDITKDLERKLTELARNILFVSNSDVFYSKYDTQLDEIADLMKKYHNLKFQIQGHTDSIGSEESNLQLSLKRVNKVLNYLVSKGVNQFNLNVKGFGESVPIDTNETAEGRAKNRRVEIKIIE
jgi:outer membrane protein OmpA-like peptidoglycan-associated protein